MRIFNQEKTQELKNVDETKGYLINDKLFVKHIEPEQEQGHYEIKKEYENGGKDVEWVVDVEGVEEHDEFEDILVFVPFSQKELNQMEIDSLKSWFNEFYAKEEQKLRRLAFLSKQTDDQKDPQQQLDLLYVLAETKRKQIEELEKQV